MAEESPWYRWYIGMLKDGTYRFISPGELQVAEKFIGDTGGAVFTHAGYLIFAANKQWWNWVEKMRGEGCDTNYTPHINVREIDCQFSEKALKWLEENEEKLKEVEGSYYVNLPRH